MKIGPSNKVEGLTWLTIEGTEKELERARQWVDKNKTLWVMFYAIQSIVTYLDGSTAPPTAVQFVLRQIKNGKGAGNVTLSFRQRLCFKSASDAMRFKLSHA